MYIIYAVEISNTKLYTLYKIAKSRKSSLFDHKLDNVRMIYHFSTHKEPIDSWFDEKSNTYNLLLYTTQWEVGEWQIIETY